MSSLLLVQMQFITRFSLLSEGHVPDFQILGITLHVVPKTACSAFGCVSKQRFHYKVLSWCGDIPTERIRLLGTKSVKLIKESDVLPVMKAGFWSVRECLHKVIDHWYL